MTDNQNQELLDLPYSERQLVIVQPDEVAYAARRAGKNQKIGEESAYWKDTAVRFGKLALNPTMYEAVALATIEAINAWKRARESGLNVLQIGRTEASLLRFPPGHPRDQTLYVAHPTQPSIYYTTAVFHRMVFEHKFAEAIRLLMSLGARTIKVEHVCGWSREFSSRMSVPLTEAGITSSVEYSAKGGSSLLFEATFNNNNESAIPADLVWFPHEPTWQTVAEGRVTYGLSKFSLIVNYEDDMGVNAGLKVRAQKAGLDLGGTFEDHTNTVWKINGEFL